MRYGVALPNYGELADAETLAHLARRAEVLGIDSIWVSDHLLAPTGVRSIYPYDRRPDAKPGDMGVIEHFYESLTTLAGSCHAASGVMRFFFWLVIAVLIGDPQITQITPIRESRKEALKIVYYLFSVLESV